MRRKLVEQGTSTLMVSLPKEWVKRQGLMKGAEVEVEESGEEILISPADTRKKSTHLSFTSESESAIRFSLINAYRAGYDKMHVGYKTEEQFALIRQIIRDYVIGFEVTRQENERCVIENITEPSSDQFDTLYRKLLYNVELMIAETGRRLEGSTTFPDHQSILAATWKFDSFCRRIMAKKHFRAISSVFLWQFSSNLGHAVRELSHLNAYLDTHAFEKKGYALALHLAEVFQSIRDAYLTRDMALLEKVHLMRRAFFTPGETEEETIVLYHLSAALRNLHLSTSPLSAFLMG